MVVKAGPAARRIQHGPSPDDMAFLWRVSTSRGTVWHAALEDSRTGERTGFADLQGSLKILEEQINEVDQITVADKREKQ